jgi:hypothetical protein
VSSLTPVVIAFVVGGELSDIFRPIDFHVIKRKTILRFIFNNSKVLDRWKIISIPDLR